MNSKEVRETTKYSTKINKSLDTMEKFFLNLLQAAKVPVPVEAPSSERNILLEYHTSDMVASGEELFSVLAELKQKLVLFDFEKKKELIKEHNKVFSDQMAKYQTSIEKLSTSVDSALLELQQEYSASEHLT